MRSALLRHTLALVRVHSSTSACTSGRRLYGDVGLSEGSSLRATADTLVPTYRQQRALQRHNTTTTTIYVYRFEIQR